MPNTYPPYITEPARTLRDLDDPTARHTLAARAAERRVLELADLDLATATANLATITPAAGDHQDDQALVELLDLRDRTAAEVTR